MRVHLETERLVLREFEAGDLDELVALHNDPDVMRYLNGGRPVPRERIENEIMPYYLEFYRQGRGFGYWAAIAKQDGRFLGWFLFRPPESPDTAGIELGYRLHKHAWGKGYATEGSIALLRKGFAEQGVTRVFAQTMAVNRGSRRVMEKAGLRYVGTFTEEYPDGPIPGAEHGEVEYAVTREEWLAQYR